MKRLDLVAVELADTVLTDCERRELTDGEQDAVLDALCMKLSAARASMYERGEVPWKART